MKKAMYIYIYIYISDQTHVSANKTNQLEGFVWRFVEYNKLFYSTNLCLNIYVWHMAQLYECTVNLKKNSDA